MKRQPNQRYRGIRSFAVRYAGKNPESEEWWAVRAMIPDSWFTKKGPGRRARAEEVWRRFTLSQRLAAVENGWFASGGPR